MWVNAVFLIFCMTFVSVGAILAVKYGSEKSTKEMKRRIAEIDREFKRRATPAE